MQAASLEEIAEKVGLDPDRFVAAVKRWNEVCETGEDTDLAVPYNSEWLVPLKKPPYYCAKIGAMIGKTLCGLRVDENMFSMPTEIRSQASMQTFLPLAVSRAKIAMVPSGPTPVLWEQMV